jgi:hypothetical protein
MKVLNFGLMFILALLVVAQAFDMLYHPDVSRLLVAQHQMEMRQLAAAQRLERQARSSTTRRGGFAYLLDDWMHRLQPPRHLPRHPLSGGVRV